MLDGQPEGEMRFATLGHSTRSQDELVEILRSHGVAQVADVRRYPGSRRHPHFAREALAARLAGEGIGYRWLPDLGGWRSRAPDSPHTAWRVAGFAAYADYMDTETFRQAARELLSLAAAGFTAILCAEARHEQCHRRLIADWLTVQGHEVVHLSSPTVPRSHTLPPFLRVEAGRLIYDGPAACR